MTEIICTCGARVYLEEDRPTYCLVCKKWYPAQKQKEDGDDKESNDR